MTTMYVLLHDDHIQGIEIRVFAKPETALAEAQKILEELKDFCDNEDDEWESICETPLHVPYYAELEDICRVEVTEKELE